MSKIAANIRHLRELKKISQEQLADDLKITRSRLGAYEESRNEPPIDILIRLSDYFGVAIDALLKGDLTKTSPESLMKIGNNRILFPVMVDKEGNNLVELVPIKVSAGYTAGYNDPEYISALPTLRLPFLFRERKYRTFQITGESMLPIPDKSYVTAEFVESLNEIRDGQAYIILTLDDGIVFKVAYNQARSKKKLLLKSLNPAYEPYEIGLDDIKEVWKFINYISHELPEPDGNKDELINTVALLQKEVSKITSSLKKGKVMR